MEDCKKERWEIIELYCICGRYFIWTATDKDIEVKVECPNCKRKNILYRNMKGGNNEHK